MKRTVQMMMIGSIGLACVSSGEIAEAGSNSADDATAVVRAYLDAGDHRDVSKCEALTHPEFRVVFTQGASGDVALMSKGDYLGLMKAEKIGGVKRTVNLEWSKPVGNIAYVKATLVADGAKFDSLFTLVKMKGRWLLVQDSVRLDLKS